MLCMFAYSVKPILAMWRDEFNLVCLFMVWLYTDISCHLYMRILFCDVCVTVWMFVGCLPRNYVWGHHQRFEPETEGCEYQIVTTYSLLVNAHCSLTRARNCVLLVMVVKMFVNVIRYYICLIDRLQTHLLHLRHCINLWCHLRFKFRNYCYSVH